ERGFEFHLQLCLRGKIDQVVGLKRVGLIVKQKPGAGQIAYVGVTHGAHAAIFAAPVAAVPLPERRGTKNKGCAIARLPSAASATAEIEAFHTLGNRNTAQT